MPNTRGTPAVIVAAIGTVVAVAALVVGIVALGNGGAHAPSKGNAPAYTVWLVEQALARYERDGLAATLDYYNSPASVDGPWYVFIGDQEGLLIAHSNAELLDSRSPAPSART